MSGCPADVPEVVEGPGDLRRNSTYTTSLTVLRLGLSVAAVPVLIRTLGLHDYGVWAVLLSLFGLTSLFQFGLASSVCFHLAGTAGGRDGNRRGEVMATSFVLFAGLGLIVFVVLLAASGALAGWLFGGAAASSGARTTLVCFGFSAWLQFMRHWAMSMEAGLQRYDVQALAESVGTVVLYTGLGLLGLLGHDIEVLAGWFTLATGATLALHWRLWRARIGVPLAMKVGWNRMEARRLVGFGLRQWVSQFGSGLFSHVDRIVVTVVLGPSATGAYAAVTSVATRINELSAAPVQIVVPAIGRAVSSGNHASIWPIYRDAHRLNMVAALGLAAAVMLGSEPLAEVLVPPPSPVVADLLRILALAYGLYAVNAVGFYAAQGLGRPSINARWTLIAGCSFLVAVLLVVPHHGLPGVAWANVAFMLTLGINFEVLRSLSMTHRLLASHGRYIATLVTLFLVSTFLLPGQPLLVHLALPAAALGLAALWAARFGFATDSGLTEGGHPEEHPVHLQQAAAGGVEEARL